MDTVENPEMTEALESARELARQRLGGALAEKATDEFCLSYATASTGGGFSVMRLMAPGAESMSAPVLDQQQAVIELRAAGREEAVPTTLNRATVALGGHGATEAITTALQTLGEDVGPAERALSLLSRQAAIRTERDCFYSESGRLRDDLERASATLAVSTNERPRVSISAAPVQACWLNSTIRANTHVSVLAEIASEKAVEQIDIPRKIEREDLDITIDSAATIRAEKGLSGAGVLVGVIDSEVQLDHPALSGRIVHRRNYTQEPFGNPSSHGTTVAGLVAASNQGFTGMAPEVQIYNYKVLATQRAFDSTEFEAYLAIQHALEDGVQVVNCSWGNGLAGDGSGREARACDKAWSLGMMIVKSAGNRGPGKETLTTPADADGILVVGASTADGASVPDYSSRGPTPGGKKRPHVLAPGGDLGAEIDGILLGGAVGTLSDVGTSFAAPHVTGLAALLIGSEPQLTPDEQRDRIIATCTALANTSQDAQGAGLITTAAL